MRYDYLIFIGRFQPFHTGHESVIRKALQLSDKVIVLIGSAYQPRTVRNPWDFNERESLMRSVFSDEENRQILAFPLLDYTYNEQLWIKSIQQLVAGVVHSKIASKPKIGLIGHQKDASLDYLNQFPQWEREEVENYNNILSTDIRELFFDNGELSKALNTNVSIALEKFKTTKAYEQVQNEFHFIKKYKSAWDKAPYTPMFITVDAVVVQSGHKHKYLMTLIGQHEEEPLLMLISSS